MIPDAPLLRVFPRRTALTPVDPLAFVGMPPLFRPRPEEISEVHVSVTFTWDVEMGERLRDAWAQHYPVVRLGGPAVDGDGGPFIPGRYVKPGVIFTTRGCNKRCPWCLVPGREGRLQAEPVIVPGHIVQDNNLLQAPRLHLEKVFEMLRQQPQRVEFSGGIDPTLVDDWFAAQIETMRISQVFLAADTPGALRALGRALERLAFLGRRKLRSYVLIGYGGETFPEAEARLRAVWGLGAMPFAQLYQPADRYISYNQEWRRLARSWSRPAAMAAMMIEGGELPDITTRALGSGA